MQIFVFSKIFFLMIIYFTLDFGFPKLKRVFNKLDSESSLWKGTPQFLILASINYNLL